MIEIPEAIAIAGQLKETVVGKAIADVVANASPHKFAWFFGDPDLYRVRLVGKTIHDVISFSGYVELHADDMCVQVSENPQTRYLRPGAEHPAKHQLLIVFDDGSALVFSAQMYAALYVCAQGENQNSYYLTAKEKPSPLSDAFDFGYFMAIVNAAKPKLSAKALLATEQRIPGLGNGVLQDILFRAGVHPKTAVKDISDLAFKKLFTELKLTLQEMTDKGGRDTEKDIFGKPGGYRTLLSNKTWQEPCPVCGGEIIKQAYMGGAVYYCQTCQPYSK